MKKILLPLFAVGLSALAVAFTVSCAKQTGPLSPSINQLGAGNGNNQNLLTLPGSGLTAPASVSQSARILFDQAVDASSIVKNSTLLIYTLDDTGTSETRYDDYNLAVLPGLKVLEISPSTGAWPNNKRYHIVFTPGVRASSGGQLDGNENHIPESEAFDTVHFFPSLGTPTAPSYNVFRNGIQVSATVATAASGSQALVFGGTGTSVNHSYSYVTITARFTPYDSTPIDFQMDPSTFFFSPTLLHPSMVLTDGNGTPVAPVNVTVTSNANANAMDTVSIVFAPAPGTKYKFMVRGGGSGVRSSNAATLRLMRGYFLAANGSGWAYAQDDTLPAVFQTFGAAGTITPYVRVTGGARNTALRCIELTYSVPTGTGTLDPATVNTGNFTLIDSSDFNPDRVYVPSRVEVDNSTAPNPVVRIYVPQYFDPQAGERDCYLRAVASKNVRASDQTPVDQTGDGLTGTDDDNYITPGSGYLFYNYTGENSH